jgi:hypothetical protein
MAVCNHNQGWTAIYSKEGANATLGISEFGVRVRLEKG